SSRNSASSAAIANASPNDSSSSLGGKVLFGFDLLPEVGRQHGMKRRTQRQRSRRRLRQSKCIAEYHFAGHDRNGVDLAGESRSPSVLSTTAAVIAALPRARAG